MTVITNFPEPDEDDASIQPDQGCYELAIQLPHEVWQRLVDESDNTHRTQNDIMQTGLILYLNYLDSLDQLRENLENTYES